MTTTISDITMKLAGHQAAFCLLGGGSALRGAVAPLGATNQRAAGAPVATRERAAVRPCAADVAGAVQKWTASVASFGATTFAEYQTVRAFRGLRPWRDPA